MSTTRNKPAPRRGFGRIEKRPNGRYRAAYMGPDAVLHRAVGPDGRGITFEAREDAESWLADRRREIVNLTWNPPTEKAKAKAATYLFGEYAATWLNTHPDLRPRTRGTYESLFRIHLEPTFGSLPLTAITVTKVREWHGSVAEGHPATRAHAYGLLRTILGTAVHEELLDVNPAHIKGAGQSKRARKVEALTVAQLAVVVEAMPERFQPMTLIAAWCGLRFGELAELRRKDVDLKAGVLRVRRAVVNVKERANVTIKADPDTVRCPCRPGCLIGPPKTDAGVRDVAIPPHLMPMLREHMLSHVAADQEALIFPSKYKGRHLPRFELYGQPPRPSTTSEDGIRRGNAFYQARVDAGVPNLRWHDLRHTGATLAGQSGATLKELMHRLGHSTQSAALLYQHASAERDQVIAKNLSRMAGAV